MVGEEVLAGLPDALELVAAICHAGIDALAAGEPLPKGRPLSDDI